MVPPAVAQRRNGGAAEQENRADIDREDLVPGVFVHIRGFAKGTDPGIVDQNIEPPPGFQRGGNGRGDIVRIGRVGREKADGIGKSGDVAAGALRSAISTFAPSPASRATIAAPMPLDPPVTSATLPSNLFNNPLLYPRCVTTHRNRLPPCHRACAPAHNRP